MTNIESSAALVVGSAPRHRAGNYESLWCRGVLFCLSALRSQAARTRDDHKGTVEDLWLENECGSEGEGEGASEPPRRVIFVDDDCDMLDSVRDALRPYRHMWRMRFAISGAAALAELEAEPADVIVSDIQMPGMDGPTLLARVQELYPATILLVLSGYANPVVVARAATVAHRILAKPCDVDELAIVVERSCGLQELTKQAEQYRLAAGATTLPSTPGMYLEISRVIADPRTGPDDIAAAIERDIAMSAKVLQLANSAFFGVGRTVNRVRDAVVYLGSDTIKALTLSAEAVGKLAPTGVPGFSIEQFQRHATEAARIAAGILPKGAAQQDAITAALLHDIGQLVLIADDPSGWRQLVAQAQSRGVPLYQVEQEGAGITHATTGGYLLSLWGLPDSVVEAVAHHHDPLAVPGAALDAVAAVHIADALAQEVEPTDGTLRPSSLDDAYVDQLGIRSRLAQWRELAHSA
jgi:HD-like signal output (HDOD) protein